MAGTLASAPRSSPDKETRLMKGMALWLIGIPIPIIILLYIFVFN